MPESGTLRLPPRVHFGYGSRLLLPEIVAPHGKRVLAIVDPFLLSTPFHDELLDGLRGLDVRVHSDITPELPVDTLDAAGAIAREHGTDVIVAVGGGSALDAAKLVALLAAHGGPLRRYYGENLVPGPVLPVVALPTTAGTGSEVTPVAVVSDPERELKVGISSPFLVPAAALVDPELTLGGPPRVTAYSGIDALVHAVESYTARAFDHDPAAPLPVFTGRNALTGPVSLLAARHLGPWLPVAVASPGDRQARAEVAKGALLAGIAFGSTGTHLCHALQYPIGALTGTPHGLGTGLLLPYVLDAVRADGETAARIAELGAALQGTAVSTVDDTIARVVDINRAIGVPASLADIGVRREDLPRVADLALGVRRLVGIAPIEASRDALLHILESAYQGVVR
ncbi:alcohol dehydrogenase [Virgisporangium aliadipatigenens]|uniref:Alcohol dehydrogenase n=1 Tax=Virgisporangium aliadipatigenens TaxID=741659 RepID=A0A8J4DSY9_9ACTN|nr:iron-containing alcohol dehydrogenase [Virgisporangium aliadipatigenens]GIJ49239.1 alcohol dehydrogenase [Virgisporangium aliadipatigenens]